MPKPVHIKFDATAASYDNAPPLRKANNLAAEAVEEALSDTPDSDSDEEMKVVSAAPSKHAEAAGTSTNGRLNPTSAKSKHSATPVRRKGRAGASKR